MARLAIVLFMLAMVGCIERPDEARIRGPKYSIPDPEAFMEYQIFRNPQYVYWVEI